MGCAGFSRNTIAPKNRSCLDLPSSQHKDSGHCLALSGARLKHRLPVSGGEEAAQGLRGWAVYFCPLLLFLV